MAKFGSRSSIVGLAVALCLGVGIIAARHWLSQPKDNGPQSTVLGANPMSQMREAVANQLHPNAGLSLDPEAAAYLAGAKAQVLSQSKESALVLFTFSDGATAEENVTLQPDQPYSPNPVELAAAAMNGSQVYNVKFFSAADGADKLQLTLQYWVPYTSLSPDIQQAIRTQTSADFFQVVPEAHAQPGMAGVGVGIVFGVGKQAGGAAIGIWSAMGKKGQNQQWMNELAALPELRSKSDKPGYPGGVCAKSRLPAANIVGHTKRAIVGPAGHGRAISCAAQCDGWRINRWSFRACIGWSYLLERHGAPECR
jgi:hypothetical protein